MATNLTARADRKDVSLSAGLRIGETVFGCSMQNLSVGGAKIISDKPLSKGDAIELVIGDFNAIKCEVVWGRAPLFGLKFAPGAEEEVADILMSVATYSAS